MSLTHKHNLKEMAVKVLINTLGQHLIAEVKQVENKETKEIVGYWLSQPRMVFYNQDQETQEISVNFGPYCLVSNEAEFSVRADHIVAILEPREDVVTGWQGVVYPQGPDAGEGVVEGEVAELDATEAPEEEPEMNPENTAETTD